ncbi:uncharacterized protein VTP21DRAFT_5617 [Calcarisporiella thermophila]|uniref:uncharacterized protein n=1 Tax=Calcarisporiella thermophila TaxID=911321 RepID=UPI0037442691
MFCRPSTLQPVGEGNISAENRPAKCNLAYPFGLRPPSQQWLETSVKEGRFELLAGRGMRFLFGIWIRSMKSTCCDTPDSRSNKMGHDANLPHWEPTCFCTPPPRPTPESPKLLWDPGKLSGADAKLELLYFSIFFLAIGKKRIPTTRLLR